MKISFNPNHFRDDFGSIYHARDGWRDDSVKFGCIYKVYGLGVNKGVLKLLLDPSNLFKPSWFSSSDVFVIDRNLPQNWKIGLFADEWSMISGYSLLVDSSVHFDGLLNRDAKELEIFRREVE